MTFLTMSARQIALVALLPKRAGATAQALARASTYPLSTVAKELKPLVLAGVLSFDEATGEYRNPGDRND